MGFVEMHKSIELFRQTSRKVVADPLSIGPIDYPNGSLQTRTSQFLVYPVTVVQE
jgi:hypothetical protein